MQQAMEAQRLQQVEQWGVDAKQQLGAKYDETVGLATTAVKAINDPDSPRRSTSWAGATIRP